MLLNADALTHAPVATIKHFYYMRFSYISVHVCVPVRPEMWGGSGGGGGGR